MGPPPAPPNDRAGTPRPGLALRVGLGPGGGRNSPVSTGLRSPFTATILFSDIESFAKRVSRIGDAAWFALLEMHNDVFGSELAKVTGKDIKAQGG